MASSAPPSKLLAADELKLKKKIDVVIKRLRKDASAANRKKQNAMIRKIMAKLAKDTPEYCYALADFITNYLYRCVKEDRADLPPKIAIVFPLSDLLLREKSKWQSDKFSTAVQYYLPTIMHYAVYNTTYHDTMAFIQMMKLWETYKVFPPDVMEKVRREVSRTTGFEFQKI